MTIYMGFSQEEFLTDIFSKKNPYYKNYTHMMSLEATDLKWL